MSVVESANPIKFTLAAATKLQTLIEEEKNDRLMLRVYVTGGGCSGFQYGFIFDEKYQKDDTKVLRDGVTLVVDPLSFQYLIGSEIDYKERLEGSHFTVSNPNAKSTCGCGASFSI